jgi:hypothetical protein
MLELRVEDLSRWVLSQTKHVTASDSRHQQQNTGIRQRESQDSRALAAGYPKSSAHPWNKFAAAASFLRAASPASISAPRLAHERGMCFRMRAAVSLIRFAAVGVAGG